MPPLRILHIARYYNPIMERKVDLMAEEPDLTFFRVRPSGPQGAYEQASEAAEKKQIILYVPFIGRQNDPHRSLYRSLTFALPAFKPDIIHAEEEPDSLPALQILGAKYLFARRSLLLLHTWQNVNRPKKIHVKMIIQSTLRGSDGILCANKEAVDILSQMGYAGPAEVIPQQGVDTDIFIPSSKNRRNNKFTLLYAGRFVKEKGLDTIFQAVSHLVQPIHLLFAGQGPGRAEIEQSLRSLAPYHSGEIIPSCKQEEMPELYGKTDALVLPSRTTPVWKEQFGRVLIEAMACRVPVIGSDSGAIPEVIGGQGLIFKEGNGEELASCLERLMTSNTLREKLSSQGYDRATTVFSQKQLALSTARWYRRMMKGSQLP